MSSKYKDQAGELRYFNDLATKPKCKHAAVKDLIDSVGVAVSNTVYDFEHDGGDAVNNTAALYTVIYACERMLLAHSGEERAAGLDRVERIIRSDRRVQQERRDAFDAIAALIGIDLGGSYGD